MQTRRWGAPGRIMGSVTLIRRRVSRYRPHLFPHQHVGEVMLMGEPFMRGWCAPTGTIRTPPHVHQPPWPTVPLTLAGWCLVVGGSVFFESPRTRTPATTLTFGSLFAGIGGIDLGLERAGMKCLWQVENDPWCQKVLAKHWPDVTRYGDIHDITDLEPVDLIAGGFPCQPVSYAGKGKAQDDDRWLWPEFHRIIRMVRPRFVLVENVPGLITRGFGDVAADLACSGYDFEWSTLTACAFGAPHTRSRLFLVGYPQRKGLERHPRPTDNQEGRQVAARSIAAANPPLRTSDESNYGHWATDPANRLAEDESYVGRVAHGVPRRVDRLRGLGNAVVPQIAEWLGHRIMEA